MTGSLNLFSMRSNAQPTYDSFESFSRHAQSTTLCYFNWNKMYTHSRTYDKYTDLKKKILRKLQKNQYSPKLNRYYIHINTFQPKAGYMS